ncbi:MAG: hypothetical protein OEU26_15540 [Candidatus Tectomicrobia bacterium]|nr:hypothetical protein [Candidatus Tectomicrobia bacterium]
MRGEKAPLGEVRLYSIDYVDFLRLLLHCGMIPPVASTCCSEVEPGEAEVTFEEVVDQTTETLKRCRRMMYGMLHQQFSLDERPSKT